MSDFDWKIWFTKLFKGLALTFGSAGCLYAAGFIVDNPLPEEYVFYGGLAIIILQAIGNGIKHKFFA